MKQKLIVLTDLWGFGKSEYLDLYNNALQESYDVHIYDSCHIAAIDTTDYNELSLHQQFVDYGIDTAVAKLLEKESEQIDVLAFSVGGTIAWKAILLGLPVRKLYSVSASRLRLEKEKPNCSINMFYGESDLFKPSLEWFDAIKHTYHELHAFGHDLYKDPECAATIIRYMLNQ